MLRIKVPITPEGWDELKQEFVSPIEITLELEHSLVTLSEWESKWCKSFISNKEKTYEETIDYIKCMTVTPNVDPLIYDHLTPSNIEEINRYIAAPMTATYFPPDQNNSRPRESVTAELIYYWMIALNIPVEFDHWHLNRLLTLIRVCNMKNQPPKKMNKRDILSRNAALNAARRKQRNTKG